MIDPSTTRPWRAAIYTRVSKDKRGDQRSVTEQEAECRAVVERNGWQLIGREVWTDNGVSASKYARKVREEWGLLVDELEAGNVDVLIVWEPSRMTRDLVVWAAVLGICEENAIRICADGKVYDPRDPDELFMLNLYFALAQRESGMTRKRIVRTTAAGVAEGRPHGPVSWGYRSVYDEQTGALLRRELDPDVAPVVAECFRKAAQGVPLARIALWVEAKGLKPPRAERWMPSSMRKLLLKPTYIGLRTHKGEITGPGKWPALIDEETYWAVNNLLHSRDRGPNRPGRARHLLSTLMPCGGCGTKMTCRIDNDKAGYRYVCRYRSCVSVKQVDVDAYVEAVLIKYLSRPEVFAGIAAPDDAEVARARGELERVDSELTALKALVGKMSVELMAANEAALLSQRAMAKKQLDQVGIPPVLRRFIGPQAAAMWDQLAEDGEIAVMREVIRTIMEIKILRSEEAPYRNARRGGINPDRIKIRWLLGAGAEANE